MKETVEVSKDTLEVLYGNVDVERARKHGGAEALKEANLVLEAAELEHLSVEIE